MLYGICYVFIKCYVVICFIWLILLLLFGGYYIFIVYRVFEKYYSCFINIVVSRKYLRKMDFLVIMICLNNLFLRSKVFLVDDDLFFVFSGLNILLCVVILRV